MTAPQKISLISVVHLHVNRFISLSEMEEIKTELNRARTHSAILREEVHLVRTSLEKEQQKHKKTRKELEELKSLHKS